MSLLRLIRGDDAALDIEVSNEDGFVDISESRLVFTMRGTYRGPVLLTKSTGDGIEHGEDGQATIFIEAADWLDFPNRRTGVWDVEETSAADIVTTVAKGRWVVIQDVTRQEES
jgi:hypothetical protein